MKIYPSVVENIARNAADHPDKLALADEKNVVHVRAALESHPQSVC